MRYGYFDDENREYVITDPRTPVKWINYLGTLAFGGFVDHTGGVLLCKGDPALNRITKYIAQLPSSEFRGTTLYLRFAENGRYQVFSPYFVPTLHPYDLYECHVGLGYTRFVSEFFGLRTEATLFVPLDGPCLISDIRITNVSDRPLAVDAVPVVEYTHPDALKQFTNADWVPQTMQSAVVDEPDGRRILLQYPFMHRATQVNYFTSNTPVSCFETDRRRFLGENEYGTWANPLSLQRAELSSYEARRGDNIAALLHSLGVIQPGSRRRIITLLGQEESLETARPAISRYRDEGQVEQAFAELVQFWEQYLSRLQVQTPDVHLNRMVNVYNPYQCYATKSWSRYLSLYQLGLGARGMGFRDSSQDVLGILASVPEEGKILIRKLLQVQKRDGSAMHQFNPLTMMANEGDAREMEDRPDYYGDDHLWIILAVTAYLRETGDLAFLEKTMPFYDKDGQERPIESGTVRDHVERALAFTKRNVGVHGLPLLGFADWNDTVNLRPGAESLFVANLYGKALLEMLDLARHLGDDESVRRYQADYEEIKARVNEQAWDGDWYVRYFDSDGRPLGSRTNAAGQIYANAQSWPVISGFAPPERATQALESVYRWLNTRNGIKLSTPGYDGYDPNKGGVTTYPPGAKENGGIFLHANPWVIMAEAIVGNSGRAFAYYGQINPAAKNDLIEEFECEPYVYPQNILGDEHPQCGLARNSWLTGTASWMYQAVTQYILGVQPAYGGLRIDPCIPNDWNGFTLTRTFRGSVYRIVVRNPDHVAKGVRRIQVDGQEIEGNVVPVFRDGGTHDVEVVMG